MRNKEIIFIRGLQNFYKYNILYPNEMKIEDNLHKYHYKNYIHKFLFDGFLLSSGITNEGNVLFITCYCFRCDKS